MPSMAITSLSFNALPVSTTQIYEYNYKYEYQKKIEIQMEPARVNFDLVDSECKKKLHR